MEHEVYRRKRFEEILQPQLLPKQHIYLFIYFSYVHSGSVFQLRCWKSHFFSGIHCGTAGMVIHHLVTVFATLAPEVDRYIPHYAAVASYVPSSNTAQN